MNLKTPTFAELFPDWWPKDIADDAVDLVSFDSKSLDEALEEHEIDHDVRRVVKAIRSMTLEVKNASSREVPLSSPEAVAGALGLTLSPPPKRWICYPLDANRRRISLPHKVTGSKVVCVITGKVPGADALPALPEGGAYLLIRRDSPSVLEIPGVVRRLTTLAREAPLCDVIFYERSDSPTQASTVYSLRRGQGAKGTIAVPFGINEEILKEATAIWD